MININVLIKHYRFTKSLGAIPLWAFAVFSAGMEKKKSPRSSVYTSRIFTRSLPDLTYSFTIRSLMYASLGLRKQTTTKACWRGLNIEIKKGTDTVLHQGRTQTVCSQYPVDPFLQSRLEVKRTKDRQMHQIWKRSHRNPQMCTFLIYLNVCSYLSKNKSTFVISCACHERYCEQFMFLEQLICRFCQEVSINSYRISQNRVLGEIKKRRKVETVWNIYSKT